MSQHGHPIVDVSVVGGLALYWIGVLSPVFAFLCTLMGIGWYSYLYYKTFFKKSGTE